MTSKKSKYEAETAVKLLLSDLALNVNRLERFHLFLESITSDSDSLAVQQLESRLDLIRPLSDKYADLYNQATSLSIISDDIMSFAEVEEEYFVLVSKASLILKNHQIKQESHSSSNNLNVSNNNATTTGSNVKLPVLNLPTFSGSYSEWNGFSESFKALIADNSKLSDVEKFFYLQDCLKGSAKDILQGLSATSSNYHIAMRMLEERYNNEKLIIFSHLESILEHPKMQRESSTDLRKLHDTIVRHLRALENLNVSDTQFKASVISYVIKNKIDSRTATEFNKFKVKQIPDIDEMRKFLSERCELLEHSNACNTPNQKSFSSGFSKAHNAKSPTYTKQSFVASHAHTCAFCKGNHQLFCCPKFLALSTRERFKKVSDLGVCKNCLKHTGNKCNSSSTCRHCKRDHNTLLCFANKDKTHKDSNPNHPADQVHGLPEQLLPTNSEESEVALSCTTADQVLLSTALIQVKAGNGKWQQARCLLDSGSQSCFATEQLVSRLGLKPKRANTSVLGINSSLSKLSGSVKVQISSLQSNFQTELSCLVIPKITECLPLKGFNKSALNIPKNVKLADTSFNQSKPVDLLIGASHFYNLMCIGQISLGKNQPVLKKTLLGWVVSGNVSLRNSSPSSISNIVCSNFVTHEKFSNEELSQSLDQFWQVENVHPESKLSLLSPAERFCEEHFEKTVTRTDTGRMMVSIPFNEKLLQLGDSENHALERFYKLEQRLNKNPTLKETYTKFIKEYEQLGHMTKELGSQDDPSAKVLTLKNEVDTSHLPSFFLPHHAVIKSDSLTTKLRVVFDGSSASNTGVSINDTQIVGPVIQDDLLTILLRYRQHAVALTGDCEKMYRMILIHPAERKFQKIFWRDNPQDPVSIYKLNTITYGTASASYLATKCLAHLAEINRERFPEAAHVIKSNFYMDDLLFSAATSEKVSEIKDQITTILSEAGIPIRKFLSNDTRVIENSNNHQTTLHTIPLGDRANAKALGLAWNSLSDTIFYKIEIKSENGPSISKRSVLSMISQLFDPLGLLSPVVIRGKILIQKLWELKLTWDESVPENISSQWVTFRSELPLLESLQIPRCVVPSNAVEVQLHGFSDSSMTAYGACIYVRCVSSDSKIFCRLLCGKSRVAPLHTVTIPRLELCAAVLLAQLMQKVQKALAVEDQTKIFLWTDSTVVLNWLRSAPNKFKIFVANRIAFIQELYSFKCWRHVRTKDNPADLVSRGCSVTEILSNSFWWSGPEFLSDPRELWKADETLPIAPDLELRKVCCTALVPDTDQGINLFNRYSHFRELQRTTAWILRFYSNCKKGAKRQTASSLTVTELQSAADVLVRQCQQDRFPSEIGALRSNQNLKSKSSILSLNPFLDKNGLLRVGGRITNAVFSFKKRHPLLLPKSHPLTNLIMEQYHHDLLHCGAQQLLACVRQRFWPVSGGVVAKQIVHNCVRCFKAHPISYNPLMGNLPPERLQFNTPAFYNTGLDYAGPILIKDRSTRNAKMIKSYICLFVCLVTKAIHLELVTDLTTKSFLSTFKRFIARRGKPCTLSSDNAKTFVGANNELRELYKFVKTSDTQKCVSKYLTDKGIVWKFIIPRAPHQGGMWESGVKSTKFHLKRVLGNTSLDFEGLSTVLTQIESVLNSRPISALSSDPEDFLPLTPGHFLIGRPLCCLPEKDLLSTAENRLTLYQRGQRLTQQFWRRWSLEVVPELQRRGKWFSHLPDLIKVDSLVLIREDNTPPNAWVLGRVLEIHRGSDSVIRSATLRLPGGHTTKRPVHKLCVLPVPQ